MFMRLREYLSVGVVIVFLIVLSETKIKLGVDKFDQLSCAANLKQIYESLIATVDENPSIFRSNPSKPWYRLIDGLKQEDLRCPAKKNFNENKDSLYSDYAMNRVIYERLLKQQTFTEGYSRKILILDSDTDPTEFNLFPLTSPVFRHTDGCNILLLDGSVIWCDKDDFTDN